MAEMMLFDNADTFNKSRANGLAGLAFNSQGDQRQSALGKLAGLDARGAMAMKTGLQEQDYSDLIQGADLLINLKDNPAMASQAYDRMKPMLERYGIQAPPVLDQTVMDTAFKLSEASRGVDNSNNVQSTFIDPQGNLNYLSRGGKVVNTGNQVSDKYNMFTDPVTGQVSGYSGRGNTLNPTSNGQPQQGGGDPMADINTRLEQGIQLRKEAGWPAEKINAWAESEWQKGQAQVQQNGVIEQGAPQAQVGVKPDASQTITPYQQQQLDLQNKKFAYDQKKGTNKPLPKWAADRYDEITEALEAGANSMQKASMHLDRIAKGELEVSPIMSGVGAIRRGTGFGNAQDANLAELKADLTEIVNQSLRLNKGVQTEGDAQRSYKEVMDSNDKETLVRALSRLIQTNKKAIILQQKRRAQTDAQLKISPQSTQAQQPAQDDDIEALLATYGNK